MPAMSEYRTHVALLRSLCEGTERICGDLQEMTQPEEAAFLEFLREHQVSPWLNPILEDESAGKTLPSTFLQELRTRREMRDARTAEVISQTRELQGALRDEGVEALFFKGIVWGSQIYGDPFLRHQHDVDLMVDRSTLRTVVALLKELGYDTRFHSSKGKELEERVRKMLHNPAGRLASACSIARGGQRVDLHCSLRARFDDSVDFRMLMDSSRDIEVEGMTLRAPSQEASMMMQLLLIASDLGSSACRAKLFLDLYLLCRSLGPGWSWDDFFQASRRQKIEKLAVNIYALFLDLWDASGEFPELAAAVDRRSWRLEVTGPTDADVIIARPRLDRANQCFFDTIYPGSSRAAVVRSLAKDLPHVAARVVGLRRSEYRFAAG